MVDEKLIFALAKVRDCLAGAADALDSLIQQESKVVLREYDVSKILWQKKDGEKGAYELATDKDNKDNSEYIALKGHLKEEDGRISKDGLFYWLFQNSDAIGRKPQKKAN